MSKLLAYNVTAIISLLICYVSLFGWKSLQKYLKKDVLIITEVEVPALVTPPCKMRKQTCKQLNDNVLHI